jgi:type II secretory pathway component PulJ
VRIFLRRTARPPGLTDRGTTLVELLVATVVTAALGGAVTAVTVTTWRTQQLRARSSDGTAAAKVATELLSRDLRDARAVLAGSAGSVTVWDDRNSDYRRQPAETLTWTVDGAGRLCRTTPVPESRCVTGGRPPTTVAFTYASDPSGRLARVGVDLRGGSDTPPRTWTVALENLQ